jgi:hypothetical protein
VARDSRYDCLRGAGYVAGDSLSADDADLGGGGGSGFSIDVDTIFPMGIEMSANATGTGSVTITFSTQDDIIKVYQHESVWTRSMAKTPLPLSLSWKPTI